MTEKSEKSKGRKKEEQSSARAPEQDQDAAGPGSAYDNFLESAGTDPEKLSAFLDKADPATRGRLVTRIQQTHGNAFVQRMLAQRQEGDEGEQEADTAAKWAGWQAAADSGAAQGVQTWQGSATITGIHIFALTAVGGHVSGPSIAPMIVGGMVGAGAPVNVAMAFGFAASNAFAGWTSGIFVPSLPWYPSFVAWPGPMAPPMPNVPTPLMAISRGRMIDAGSVATRISIAVGPLGDEPGAQAAISAFAATFATRFAVWIASTMVTLVMGSGPVPSFAPPYIPIGPVVAGDAFGPPGFLQGPAF